MTIFSFMSVGWGQFDTEPPEIVDFQFTSGTILDVTDEHQQLYYSISVTDDMSGVDYCYGWFYSPSGIDYFQTYDSFNSELELTIEGDKTVEQFVEPGLWILNEYTCVDETQNVIYYSYEDFQELGFSYEFEVINNPPLCNEETEVELWGECYNIEETTELELSDIDGEIPPEIGNLTNLESLTLYSNQLTGEIPPEIGNLTNLIRLNLMNNQLTGEIPSEIWNMTNLTTLHLGWNELTGEIPQAVCDLIESNNLDINNILEGNNLTNTCD